MRHLFQRWIVSGIEGIDRLLDGIPSWEFDDEAGRRRWFRHGCWGCRLHLAALSWRLEERWDTGHWRPVVDADPED